jgi:DIS3-like exonuclease 2
MAWDSDNEEGGTAANVTDGEDAAEGDVEWTESDYERQEEEIDRVVDVAELEEFAGTMLVDADDVELKREKIAEATAKGQQSKKERQEKARAKKPAGKAGKKPAKPENGDTWTLVTDEIELVIRDVDLELVASASAVANVKEKKKKQKQKKPKKVVKETDTVFESVEVQEVAELVEIKATQKKKQKKKENQQSAEEATSGDAVDGPATQPKQAKKESKKSAAKQSKKEETGSTASKKKDKKTGAADVPVKDKAAKKDKQEATDTTTAAQGESSAKERKKHPHDKALAPRENFYEDYSDRATVLAAVERGELYQGKLRINPQYRLRAFLTVDGIPVDVLIDGVKDRNRAMDGDLVAVKLLDETQWKPLQKEGSKEDGKGKLVVEKHGPVPSGDVEDSAKEADRKVALNALWRPTLEKSRCFLPQHQKQGKEKNDEPSASPTLHSAASVAARSAALQSRPTAKVVCILAAGNAQGFVGSLEPKTKSSDPDAPLPPQDDYAYFNAQDLRLPRRIRIPRLQLPDEFISHPHSYSQQMTCFCRLTKWSASHESPMGEFVKTLGEYSGIESGITAILMTHGLMQHTLDFRHEILSELDEQYGTAGEKWTIPDTEVALRRDFRKYQIFSIDPYNARDLDDALHIRALNEEASVFEVGVHLADVTHFIDKGSILDTEAQQRATSVYLANRVLPMLPRILCERLCSLQPQVDRLAFSVVWQMNRDGSLVEGCEPWFGKSIIRSCCKLDYGTAQRMLDGTVTTETLEEWEPERRPIAGDNPAITNASVIKAVKHLWTVAKHRRATRFDTGAVTLQDIKLTFTLDAVGNPLSYGTYQIKDSNRLVEEYMLLANYLVAQKLLQTQGPLAFLRGHPEPNENALTTTLSMLSENTIAMDGSSPKQLSESLDAVKESRGDYVYGVVQNLITKPMRPAEYLVAGNAGNDDVWRHYALNIPYYTHFTSPIRRYADVVVHRLLQESIVESETVTARIESPSEELVELMNELQSVAHNCNEKKMAAKHAEQACDQVFLCAFVKHHGTVNVTGVVVSTGPRSFTVYISELGLEQRIEVRDLGSVRWSWQETTATLALEFGGVKKAKRSRNKKKASDAKGETNATVEETNVREVETPDAKSSSPERVELKFLTKLCMRMTTTDRMPLALKFEVVSPWKE